MILMVEKKYMKLASEYRKRLIKLCPYIFVFIVAFLLSCYIITEMDDLILKDAINKYGSLIEWARFYGKNWGGRLLSQGLLVVLLQLPDIFFQIINAFMWTLLIAYIVKIFDYNHNMNKEFAFVLFFFMMVVLLPSNVLRWTVFWKSASVSYVWGTASALVTMLPIVKIYFNDVPSVGDWIFAFICCVYAANYEQIAVFMCVGIFGLLLNIFFRKDKLQNGLIIRGSVLLLLSIVFTMLFLSMPGNKARLTSEIIQWYPNFNMYSIYDKAFIGINYAIGESEKRISFLFLALSFIVLLSNLKKSNTIIRIISFICFIFYLFNFIHRIGDSFDNSNFYVLSRLFALADFEGTDFAISAKRTVAECVNVVMISFLGTSLCTLEERKFDMIIFISFFGGLATMVMMGFSPTIYASGNRSMFICFLLLLSCLFRSSLVIKDKILKMCA